MDIESADLTKSFLLKSELKDGMNINSPKRDIDKNKIIHKNKEKKSIQENLTPSLLEFTKNISVDMDKTFVFEQKENSLSKKDEKEKLSYYSVNNNLIDIKDKIDNRNLIISKIENKDIFKRIKENEKQSFEEKSISSPDILTDLKKSLDRYNLIISQQEKKIKKISEQEPFINTKEEKKIVNSLPLTKSKNEILLTFGNIENENKIKETVKKPSSLVKSKSEVSLLNLRPIKNEDDLKEIKDNIYKPSPLVKSKSEISLLNLENEDDIKVKEIKDNIYKPSPLVKSKSEISLLNLDIIKNEGSLKEIKENNRKTSPLVKSKSEVSLYNFGNIKNVDTIKENIHKPLPLVKSKSEISLLDLDVIKNKEKINENIPKPSPLVKSKSEFFFKALNKIKIHKEKNDETEKYLVTSILYKTVSPSNEKKDNIGSIDTPLKRETLSKSVFHTPKKVITPKKFVSEHFKALWDSTTKSLHSTFSLRKSSTISSTEDRENIININNKSNFNYPLSSIKLYSSPEHEPNLSFFSKGSKSTDFKREIIRDRYMKGSSSIPVKNKMKYFFGTSYENLHIDFNNYKSKSNIFNKNFDSLDKNHGIESSNISIQSPPDSPLAKRSKGFSSSNVENLTNTNINENKLFKLKKSISDLTEIIKYEKETEDKKLKKSSWNTTRDLNYQSELTSPIPETSKLKPTSFINTKSKIATLASAKLIKKQKERQNFDKKQKVKMNVERHKLYLERKKKEVEEERQREVFINNAKPEEQQQKESQEMGKKEKEEKRIESEKLIQQMKLDMELLIRKRNEKIKQVQERKQALKHKELTKKSILLNSSYLYGNSTIDAALSSSSSNIPKPSSFDQYKTNKDKLNKIKGLSSIETYTIKNSNGKRPSLPFDKPKNSKKASVNTSKVPIPIQKSSLLKFKSSKVNSNILTKIRSIKTNDTSKNLPLEKTKPKFKPILNDLIQQKDEIFKDENDSKNSIISISSSRSSNTYKETILQDGEIPDISSE